MSRAHAPVAGRRACCMDVEPFVSTYRMAPPRSAVTVSPPAPGLHQPLTGFSRSGSPALSPRPAGSVSPQKRHFGVVPLAWVLRLPTGDAPVVRYVRTGGSIAGSTDRAPAAMAGALPFLREKCSLHPSASAPLATSAWWPASSHESRLIPGRQPCWRSGACRPQKSPTSASSGAVATARPSIRTGLRTAPTLSRNASSPTTRRSRTRSSTRTPWDTSGQWPSRWRWTGPTGSRWQGIVMHKNPVRADLRQQVLSRDIGEFMKRIPIFRLRRSTTNSVAGCVAVFLAPSTSGPCWGKLTLDHIKDEQRAGKRAPSDPAHLVSLCQGHTEDGMRAGHQWNTANRPVLRWYLKVLYHNDPVT